MFRSGHKTVLQTELHYVSRERTDFILIVIILARELESRSPNTFRQAELGSLFSRAYSSLDIRRSFDKKVRVLKTACIPLIKKAVAESYFQRGFCSPGRDLRQVKHPWMQGVRS